MEAKNTGQKLVRIQGAFYRAAGSALGLAGIDAVHVSERTIRRGVRRLNERTADDRGSFSLFNIGN